MREPKIIPDNKEKLADLVSKHVKCGYHMPLIMEYVKKIKDGVIALYVIT